MQILSNWKEKKRREKMFKKGNLLDWFYIIAVLVFASMAMIAIYMVIDKTIGTGLFDDNTEAQAAMETTRSTIVNFDNIFLFIIIGLSVFVLASAYFVWNHPAFFFISLFLLCIAIIVGALASNTYEDITSSAALNESAQVFAKTTFLMGKLPVYIAILGIMATIVMFVGYGRQ